MLKLTIDTKDIKRAIAVLEPDGPFSKEDFISVAKTMDAHIDKHGNLAGVIMHSKDFPGWKSFGAFCEHITFIKNHHNKVDRVAPVTDSTFAKFMRIFVKPFVSAEIKIFPFDSLDKAKAWIAEKKKGG